MWQFVLHMLAQILWGSQGYFRLNTGKFFVCDIREYEFVSARYLALTKALRVAYYP